MYSVMWAILFHVLCVIFRNTTVEKYLWKMLRYLQFSWPSFVSGCSGCYIFYVSSSQTSLDFFLPSSLEAQFSAASLSAVLEYNGPCNPVFEYQDLMWACAPIFRPGTLCSLALLLAVFHKMWKTWGLPSIKMFRPAWRWQFVVRETTDIC